MDSRSINPVLPRRVPGTPATRPAGAPTRTEPLLRTLIGEALRTQRQGQQRTLRNVSQVARVSLGYLSEIERGQKEASSELLAAICSALEIRLVDVLHDVFTSVTGASVHGAGGGSVVESLPVRHGDRGVAPAVNRAA